MGIVNKSIPRIYKDNIGNIKVEHSPIPEEVVIDDAFDPLFNAKAREYLTNKYGGPVVGTLGGFAEMWENALAPKENKWGKLGPAMGVLGTFGRTIDKAEDFLLGGITEGVNALNYVNPLGTREVKPSNPIENIFIKDEDYSGQRLFAAMANSMSKLAGGTTLNEEDFTGTWAIPSIEAELITDPGIAGGALARAYSPTAKAMSSSEILNRLRNSQAINGTTLGDVSQLLSNYDDLLAKGAWDVTLPGVRPIVKGILNNIKHLVGHSDIGEYVDTALTEDEIMKLIDSPPTDDTSNIFKASISPNEAGFTRLKPYAARVNENLNKFSKLDFDNTTDAQLNEILNSIIASDSKILEDPELADDIMNIRAAMEARDILTNGTELDITALQKARDTYVAELDKLETPEKLKEELDNLLEQQAIPYTEGEDYRKFYKKRQKTDKRINEIRELLKNPDALKANSKVTAAKMNLQNTLRNFYMSNYNIFDEHLKNTKANVTAYDQAFKNSLVTRSDTYSKELDNLVNKFKKDLPNLPKEGYRYGSNYDKIINDKQTLDYVREEFLSSYGDTAKGENLKDVEAGLVGKTTDFNSWAEQNEIPLDELSEKEIDGYVKEYIEDILNGNVGEYPENVIHKHNLEVALGFNSSKEITTSPVYFSFSTREWQRIPTQSAINYVKTRLGQAVLESPTLWTSQTASEYFDNLRKDPAVLKAIDNLNYVDKYGKQHDMAGHFKFLLDSILDETFVYTKGEKAGQIGTMDDLTKLLGYYDELSNTVIEMVKHNPELHLDYTTFKPLIEWAEDVRTNVFNEMYIKGKFWKDAESMEEAFQYNKVLNNYLHSNPDFFLYKPKKYMPIKLDTYINLDKLAEYTSLAPHFEVQISKKALASGNYGFIINGEFINGDTVAELLARKDKSAFNKMLDTIRFNKSKNVKGALLSEYNITNTTNAIRKESLDKLAVTFDENLNKAVSYLSDEDVIPRTFNSNSMFIEDFYKNVEDTIVADYITLPDNVLKLPEGAPTNPKQYLSKEGVRLFDLLEEMKSIRTKNALGNLATLRNKQYLDLANEVKEIIRNMPKEDLDKFFALRDLMTDDIIKGDSLFNDILESGGFTVGAFNKNSKINEFDAAREAIEHNIKATTIKLKDGTDLPLFKILEFEDDNARYIGLRWNVEQGKLINKNLKSFKFDKLKDIVFHKGIVNDALTSEMKRYARLNEAFAKAQNISSDMLKTLGIDNNLYSTYTHHALVMGEGNLKRVKWLEDTVYANIPDNIDLLNTSLMKNSKIKGVFGVVPMTRSLRGNITDWNASANVFSTNPSYVLKSQFSNGIFANQDVQVYTDMFINDNFKLSTYKLDKNRLKEILYLKDSQGRLGNLNNLELVAPVFDEATGQLKKFKRFDKLSDTGIEQALKNPDTILVPTWSIAPLDKMLRKDAKMSNKFYALANKYLINPFKFGTLINPGFLIGNVNDAYLKQATTMSHKYGTSMAEELENVAISIRQTMQINNTFADEVWEQYVKDTANDIEKYPYLKIMSTMPESNMSSKHFLAWFDAKRPTLTDKQINVTSLWMYLNSAQQTSAFRDIESLKDLQKINEFDVTNNPLETALQKMTVDNKIGDFVFRTNETTETLARSSAILNDLTHKYSIDDIERILGNVYERDLTNQKIPGQFGFKKTKEYKELQIQIQNAINAMNNANFDYNNMPDFMDFMSTFIPFPTFYLKNMCYWIDIAANNPEYLDTAITIQDNAWRDRQKELKSDKFTAEAKGRGAIPLDSVSSIGRISSKLPNPLSSITPQFKGIFKPTPLNSMFGAFNSLQNPVKDLGQRIHPALSPITHHLLENEDVKYRPYSSNPYEKNIKKGDPNFSMLKYTFHRLNPYERAINTGLRTPNKLKEGTAQLYDFAPSVFQPDFSKKSNKNKK